MPDCSSTESRVVSKVRMGVRRIHNAEVDGSTTRNEHCTYSVDLRVLRLRRGADSLNGNVHGY